MSKVGIGVGEEFPLGDPPPDPPEPERRYRHGGWHVALHIGLRIALIALVIAVIAWMFTGFGAYAGHGPYAYYPGWHRHFFFPFFPLFLVLLLIFAFRRRHYYGYCHFRRWRDELHHERGERF